MHLKQEHSIKAESSSKNVYSCLLQNLWVATFWHDIYVYSETALAENQIGSTQGGEFRSFGHHNNKNNKTIQKALDAPKVSATADTLLRQAPDAVSRSRLLAASRKESGAWLNALPVSSLGLRMDNNTVRVAVGLRLGSLLCRPHTCHHCGMQVDGTATHGLSCKWSEGRHQRHAAVNDIIHCALSAAHLPSRLEPTGLSRSDGNPQPTPQLHTGGHRDGRPFWTRDCRVLERTGLPSQTGHQGSQVFPLPAAMPVRCIAMGKCCCSDGSIGGHHLPF